MHVIVVGCGRVGSTVANELVAARPRRRRDRPPARGVPSSRVTIHRRHHDRGRIRSRRVVDGRDHRAERRDGRHQRRQLQHPHRPSRPRDVRRRTRRRPHLRPPAGGGLRASRHPHRRLGLVDERPRPAPRAPRSGTQRLDRPDLDVRARRAQGARRHGRRVDRPTRRGRPAGRAADADRCGPPPGQGAARPAGRPRPPARPQPTRPHDVDRALLEVGAHR